MSDAVTSAKVAARLVGKRVNDMTKQEFYDLPRRDWDEDIGLFDGLVILPTDTLHDSGYLAMDFVATKDGVAICRLSGCSDVLHINGIGGMGKWKPEEGIPKMIPTVGWSIDCLKCGLLQLFAHSHDLYADPALSSFCVYSKKEGG